jgi:hypothetical protein
MKRGGEEKRVTRNARTTTQPISVLYFVKSMACATVTKLSGFRIIMLSAQAGKGGDTTLTADIPPDVDREDPKAVERFVRSAAKRSGYFAPGTRP